MRFLLLAAAALTVSGCGPRPAPEKKPVVIHYWEKWTGIEAEAIERAVDDFNASQHDIRVELLTVSGIASKLMIATAGGNPPDLCGTYSQQIPACAENNALQPLDGYLAEAGIAPATYLPGVWQALRHRGYTWALPTTPATVALYWNKKMFRAAGLDPEKPPKSLAELEAMNDRLLRRSPEGRLLQLGHTPQQPGWWNALWVYWFGGGYLGADGRLTVDSPAMNATFDWLAGYPRRFDGRRLLDLGNGFGNFASPQNPFFTGRLAMVQQGPWFSNFILQYAPAGFEYGVAPFPTADPARLPGITILESDVVVIPAGARHPREAFRFMQYLDSQPVLEKLCRAHTTFSPLSQVSPAFYAGHANPYIRVFRDLAAGPGVRLAPRTAIWSKLTADLDTAVNSILLHGDPPGDYLPALQREEEHAYLRQERRWERLAPLRLDAWSHLVTAE